MFFQRINLAAGEADSPDPRATPATVPKEKLLACPKTLPNTDQAPTKALIWLEGTTAQTVTLTPFALDEAQVLFDAALPADSARRFYQLAAPVTVTVGAAVATALVAPGTIYWRCTTNPAAASTVLIGYAAT